MKRLKTLLFTAAIAFGAVSFTNAQSKIAHIDTEALIKAMPAYTAAQGEVEKLGKTYEAEFQASIKELDTKLKQYNAEAKAQTAEENARRKQEVDGMRQALAQYQQTAQQNIQKKEFELLKPITEKAEAAIQKVAAAQGYQYVMDAKTLIVAKGKDLMADVKKELGI